jgi:hypothetical protein
MLRAIGVVIAAVATFAFLVSTQVITVEAKPSESITINGLSPQGGNTLAVACSTFLETCKPMDSQNNRKTVEAKPSERSQGGNTLAVACSTFLETCKPMDSQNNRKTVEAKPSERSQGGNTLAVACSTFLETCKPMDSSRKIVEAKPSESITIDGLSPPQGKSTLGEERTYAEMVRGLSPPQGKSTLAEERTYAEMMWAEMMWGSKE